MKMFSRPVSSGWNPVPTSSRVAVRPHSVIRPSVGGVIPRQELQEGALAGPVGTDKARRSLPGAISSETSRRAQSSSWHVPAASGGRGCRAPHGTERGGEDVLQLLRELASTTVRRAKLVALADMLHADRRGPHGSSDDVGEGALRPLEVGCPAVTSRTTLMTTGIRITTTDQSEVPNSVHRYASSKPTTGLRAYSGWRFSGTRWNGYVIGLTNNPTRIRNGTSLVNVSVPARSGPRARGRPRGRSRPRAGGQPAPGGSGHGTEPHRSTSRRRQPGTRRQSPSSMETDK